MTADRVARTRVLLADDQAAMLESWRGLLEPEFEVIAGVANGEALVEAAERLSPDVIVTDISLPRISGIVAAEAILRRHPAARIVFATAHADLSLLRKGIAVGAFGYVLKVRAGEEPGAGDSLGTTQPTSHQPLRRAALERRPSRVRGVPRSRIACSVATSERDQSPLDRVANQL